MAIFFLDSSAVVKRYTLESGSAWGMALCDPSVGNAIVMSQAALVEVVGALCRKAVRGDISAIDRDRGIASFRRDATGSYAIQRVTSRIYRQGGDLCRAHDGLRAYDAIQLACALALRDQLAPLGIAPIFVSADARLLVFASREGLMTADPSSHP